MLTPCPPAQVKARRRWPRTLQRVPTQEPAFAHLPQRTLAATGPLGEAGTTKRRKQCGKGGAAEAESAEGGLSSARGDGLRRGGDTKAKLSRRLKFRLDLTF